MAVYKEVNIDECHTRTISSIPADKKAAIDSILEKFVTYFKEEELG